MAMRNGRMVLLALNSGIGFANRVCHEINRIIRHDGDPLNFSITPSTEVTFANGEKKVVIEESVRGKDVYIVQLMDDPHSDMSVNDNIFALASAINAAYYSDAARITAVIPQFPYSRQDKKKGREPITAKIFGNLLEVSGVNKIITLDIHSEAIEGFFNRVHMENLHAGRLLIRYVQTRIESKNLMVVAPDVGSAKRGLFFAKALGKELAIIEKSRDYSKQSAIEDMTLVGNVRNKDVFINDDMIATGGTLLNACRLLKSKGAGDIYISVSLPYFSKDSHALFDAAFKEGLFKRLIGTDGVFWGKEFSEKYSAWYEELSMAPLFAKVISNMNLGKSVSRLLA